MPNWAWAGYLAAARSSLRARWTASYPAPLGNGTAKPTRLVCGMLPRACTLDARCSRKMASEFPPWMSPGRAKNLTLLSRRCKQLATLISPLTLAWPGQVSGIHTPSHPSCRAYGGDIIDRSTMLTAEGVLNGDEAIAFGEWWQSLSLNAISLPAPRRTAPIVIPALSTASMLCSGTATGRLCPALDAFGDDMLFLPAPDFGQWPGHWRRFLAIWHLGRQRTSQTGANAFIEFAIQPEYSAAFSDVLGLAPTTLEAAGLTENYAPGGPLEVFFGTQSSASADSPADAGLLISCADPSRRPWLTSLTEAM